MGEPPFTPLPAGYPFPELEREVLAAWRVEETFAATLQRPAPQGDWVLYDGPPTANNVPHVGHVLTRVVKDLFPRYRTMRGYRVLRKAGWDTHGLPVEIEVEKRLGFSGKREIEAYGIAAFNQACLESVHSYERQWRVMTERVGYWTDLDHPYFTYSNPYIESVWWALSQLWERGLLRHGHKIQPYCARCGTTLSSHEVAQNYRDADDPSVWVLFPARGGQGLPTTDGHTLAVDGSLRLVAWTTTPWTLLAHVALAVHPELTYRVVADPARAGGTLLFAAGLETPVPTAGEGGAVIDLRQAETVAVVRGSDLVGLRYERPFTFFPPPDGLSEQDAPWRVVPGDYVTATEGTGLVHTAPPFGEDDYRTGQSHGLPFHLAVDGEGKVAAEAAPWAGRWFKDADPAIVAELRRGGRLLFADRVRHSYPFCWRCDRPLLYYATASWFAATTERRDRMVELNRGIDWHPAHVREGRFGNWLENVVDWALSRRRYWGTPLPVWRCDGCDEVSVVGSFPELFRLAGRTPPADLYDREQFDPHRPAIDAFTWPCTSCDGGTMRREEEVIDAWFDSGAMPFAQLHYPFENRELFARQFPADLISEAVDQTRGWFYTLHALAALLFDSVAYRSCVVLGHVNDEDGRKMSKRLGNVVDPMEVLEEAGADALRWTFYVGNPEQTSRFSARLVREAAQRFLLPLWNAASFFVIYANLDSWLQGKETIAFGRRPALDRWMLLRLDRLVRETAERLDGCRIADAARGVETFVDELTNWYIRRSRQRFWAPGEAGGADKESAYQTLYEVLATLSRVLAPFTPFVADVLHRRLVIPHVPGAPPSVHLTDWPLPGDGRRESVLEAAMEAVQRIVRLGHGARQSHGLKTRQPLARVTVVAADAGLPALVGPHEALLREELNVKAVAWAADRSAYVDHEVRPIFPRCGPRFGRRMPALKAALEAADGEALAAELARRGAVTVTLEGEAVELAADEVEVRLGERPGAATQAEGDLLVALDTELTPELVAEGLAREVVHRVQSARKEADLDYADRIRLRYRAAGPLAAAIADHRAWIAGETLAVEVTPVADNVPLTAGEVDGHPFDFAIERTSN